MKLAQWGSLLFPLVLVFLFACDQAREAERLFAAAQEAEKAGQLEVAADLYHRAAGLNPHDFDLHYRAALLYLRAGHFPEAEEPLRKAIALRPDYGPAHLNLGAVLLQQGKKEEGRKELIEALRLDAGNQSLFEQCYSGSALTGASYAKVVVVQHLRIRVFWLALLG